MENKDNLREYMLKEIDIIQDIIKRMEFNSLFDKRLGYQPCCGSLTGFFQLLFCTKEASANLSNCLIQKARALLAILPCTAAEAC